MWHLIMDSFKKTTLKTAVAAAMGISATPAGADLVNLNFDGVFTVLSPTGQPLSNPDSGDGPWYGDRTPYYRHHDF